MLVQRGERCLHGLLMWLNAPGQGVSFVDLDPANNVRLLSVRTCCHCQQWKLLTLLWTSSCSMPAMAEVRRAVPERPMAGCER